MSVSLDKLVAPSGSLLVENYLNYGLIICDYQSVSIAIGLFINDDESIYVSRQIKLELDENWIFSKGKFVSILVNECGSRLALVGVHSVHIVDLPSIFWNRQFFSSIPPLEQFDTDYSCRCRTVECVGSQRRNIAVVKVRWYVREHGEIGIDKTNKFAVLYSDNVVRIYDAGENIELPIMRVDFRSVMNTWSHTNPKSMGLHAYIVSFDFGPIIMNTAENGSLCCINTILAIDSECNEVYISTFQMEPMRLLKIQGPVVIQSSDSDNFVLDLLYLKHKHNRTLPVMALLMSKGSIKHFILLSEIASDDSWNFSFVLFDELMLSCRPSFSTNYHLRNDSLLCGRYLVNCGISLFLIEVTHWVNQVAGVLNQHTGVDISTACLSHSVLHHLFGLLGDNCLDNSEASLETATSMPLLFDDELSCATSDVAIESQTCFIAVTSIGDMLFKIISEEKLLSNDMVETKNQFVELSSSYTSLYDQCHKILQKRVTVPKLKINDRIAEDDALSLAGSIVDALVNNLVIIKLAYQKAQSVVEQTLNEARQVSIEKSKCMERLLNVLSDYVELKNRIYAIQKKVAELNRRSEQAFTGLVPRLMPLTDAENTLIEKTKSLRMNTDGITRIIPHIANEVALRRREHFGIMRPFCASISARKFILTKNTDEISEMVGWIKQLDAKVKRIQSDTLDLKT